MNNEEVTPGNLGGLGDVLPAELLKLVNELLEQQHQAGHPNNGSKIEIVYVASGGQHVDTQINIGDACPKPKKTPKGEDASTTERFSKDTPMSALFRENHHEELKTVIESDFVQDFHPFRFYLEHLPPWNGENHILAMSVSVMVKGEVEEQMRFAEYLTKWLVGMVAGWIDETVVNNVILVLIGEQGSYKTTWFNYLLPPELSGYFYTKTNANKMGRRRLWPPTWWQYTAYNRAKQRLRKKNFPL